MNLDLILFQEIEKLIIERQHQLSTELVVGKAADFCDYRFRVGKLRGLQDALEMAKVANDKVIGIDRKER